jgi:heme-degrading monooxygenase HmoA
MRNSAMMTIISETTIQPGQEPQWDKAFQERIEDARKQPGWVSLQLLIPTDAPNKRLVIGTWQTRADWEAWHNTETFQRTRQQMNSVEQSLDQERWYEVISIASA